MIKTRRPIAGDIPALIDFQREGWFEDYAEVIPAGYAEYATGIYGTAEAIKRQIASDLIYLVAEEKGTVIACATAEILNPDEAEVWWIHTAKGYRQRGIGRRLIDAIIQQLAGKVPMLCVTTFQDYTPTLTFYERLGFCVQQTTIYEVGPFRIPDVRLCKAL
ncbi:MAG: GNAT family N-acetyltransferase [Anaerolineae bacterium]